MTQMMSMWEVRDIKVEWWQALLLASPVVRGGLRANSPLHGWFPVVYFPD